MIGHRVQHRRSFALVLTMFLVALLATTGTGLALTAAAESIMVTWTGRDLDHRLAVDSFISCLPQLRRAQPLETSAAADGSRAQRLRLTVGECELEGRIRPENGKLQLGAARSADQSAAGLRQLAHAHGLPEENVKLLPIPPQREGATLPSLVWFDQVIQATQFEEIFRWAFPAPSDPRSPNATERTAWSDLISFWNAETESVLAIEIETRIGTDARRWYIVAVVADHDVRVLYRDSV